MRARAERSLLAEVAGGCVVPLAGFAELEGESLRLRARLGHPEKGRMLESDVRGHRDQAVELGRRAGVELLDSGGAQIVAAAKALSRG